jgi:uncharacterized protein YndB with AHSA1/START domain
MKWLWIVLAVLAGLVAIVAGIGALLPQNHIATRAARFHQPPDTIWAAITDVSAFPGWRPGVKRVERPADRNGLPAWREVDNHGQEIALEVVGWAPPQKLVVRIADPKLPFGGTWMYDVRSVEGGSELRITENGEVYNPVFRFLSRFVFGYHGTVEAYLRALGKKFGETVQLEE